MNALLVYTYAMDDHESWVARVHGWHDRVMELKATGMTYTEAADQARKELDTEPTEK